MPISLHTELRRHEPISDAVLLAAIDRAERHANRLGDHQPPTLSDLTEHLGFVMNGWTSSKLRRQLEPLIAAGAVKHTRPRKFDRWALTDKGRATLAAARSRGDVVLPESPRHQFWRAVRALAAEQIDGLREQVRRLIDEADQLLLGSAADAEAWLALVSPLEQNVRALALATYCLHDLAEPEDDQALGDDPLRRGQQLLHALAHLAEQ